MRRWQVKIKRQFIPSTTGQRRWDLAYQHLLRLSSGVPQLAPTASLAVQKHPGGDK